MASPLSFKLQEALLKLLRAAELVQEPPAGNFKDSHLMIRTVSGVELGVLDGAEYVNCRAFPAADHE